MFHRLRQGVRALLVPADVASPTALSNTPVTAAMFAVLAAHDRRHLTAVQAACLASDLSDEVVSAGLLHDVAKASLSGRTVSVVDRSLHVILGGLTPGLLSRLAEEPAGGVRLGFQLALHHPALGAGRLAALGWPSPVTDLVRDHASPEPSAELAALQLIDDATP